MQKRCRHGVVFETFNDQKVIAYVKYIEYAEEEFFACRSLIARFKTHLTIRRRDSIE